MNDDPRKAFDPLAEETLEPTWWVMDQESGMDDLVEQAGDSLDHMGEDLGIYPFQDTDSNDRLFLARYELPKFGENFQYSEAIFAPGEVAGFIDFLGGFPIDCVEMLVAIGEWSSKGDQVKVKDGIGKAAAPGPDNLFQWPESDKVFFNLTAIPTKDVAKIFAPNLSGEAEPQKTHWWIRVNLASENKKWPIPGEFLGLGVRMMPDKPWGKQKSSPFLYSGNWMDTVFYTSAVVKSINDPTDDQPYPTYEVQWRKDTVTAKPSDFAEYQVGDRVTILKDVAAEKQSQTWEDDDTKDFDTEGWVIVPISFYGLEDQEV